MTIPKQLENDIVRWRKYKHAVTKYFDGDIVGMKLPMDNVSPWTSDILNAHYMANPIDGIDCALSHARGRIFIVRWKRCPERIVSKTGGN